MKYFCYEVAASHEHAVSLSLTVCIVLTLTGGKLKLSHKQK